MGKSDVGNHAMIVGQVGNLRPIVNRPARAQTRGAGQLVRAKPDRFLWSAFGVFFLLATAAQAQSLRPLHVSPSGFILDDSGKPVLLRGLNRSGAGSGNADANATDAEYAAQNQLLSMNLVRIFVNASWWTSNVQVPIANMKYQDYIDQLIQRAKKYGNYVLILKAGQFPDAPCGADGKNCPAPNQGDLNCQANSSVCAAQDTTGNNIDTAFNFWGAFAQKYAADTAILYDTWEDMHGIDANTWSDDQDELIAAIRTYSPQSVIFVEDTGTAFESIVQGSLPDFAWSNIVWNFHLYNASTGGCTEPASPRSANWPQNIDPLVSYARLHGHGAGIAEWGGCNDADPYHTNITSYAKAHDVALAYFDNTNLLTASGGNFQLTATGTKVAQAYTSIAAGGLGPVANLSSANYAAALAPEAIAAAFGANLATGVQVATAVPLPTLMQGTSVTVTDQGGISRLAGLYFVSPSQINYEMPPGVGAGTASVTVSINGLPVASGPAQIATVAPGLYTATSDGKGIAAAIALTIHADQSSSYIISFQCTTATSCTANPIDVGLATDTVVLELYGTGIRGRSGLAGVTCKIGSTTLPVSYAGLAPGSIGEDQVNVVLPKSLRGAGNQTVTLTVDGLPANVVTLNFK
jgi:uncharacterized protein (TIGR03437 family)